MSQKILLLGANGQIGSELVETLRNNLGKENVISSDITPARSENGPHEIIDVLDKNAIEKSIINNEITQVYHLAALLSATGEKNPKLAWDVNMNGLLNVLDLAVKHKLEKVFWPSSIAAFGPTTPMQNTPQDCIMDPETIYGITKQAGERWCAYYHKKFGLDVRSIRYPGILSHKTLPGGGTTDYAIDIFIEAQKQGNYNCFLTADTYLPMMFMDDAVANTLMLMDADVNDITVRSSYNLGGVSFSPASLTKEIQKHLPNFTINYMPDFRQQIADTWPASIDDSVAKNDWNCSYEFTIEKIVDVMLAAFKVEA